MSKELKDNLNALKDCVSDAPEGKFKAAETVNQIIGDACDSLIKALRASGLKADTCDRVFLLEAQMYQYVKESNPELTELAQAEAFANKDEGHEPKRSSGPHGTLVYLGGGHYTYDRNL